MKIMKPVFLCAAGIATGLLFAEDLRVEVGQSVTVSENATYDNVVVNGSLTVADGKVLSVTKLVIGDGSDGSKAEVFVESDAKINVSSTDSAASMILGNGNPAEMTLRQGSTVSVAGGVGVGYNMTADGDTSSKIKLVLEDATFESAGVMTTRYTSADKDYPALAQIALNGRVADFRVQNLHVMGAGVKFRIRFNGGRIRFDQWYNYGNSPHIRTGSTVNNECILESVDSNPIRLFASSGASGNAFFSCPRADGTIRLEGDGVVWNEGPAFRPLVHSDNKGKVVFGNAGGIMIPSGCSLPNSGSFAACLAQAENAGCKLTVAAGGLFDLAGCDVSLDGIASAGTVTNSSSAAATLTVGKDNGDVAFVAPPAKALPVVKTGTGTLKIPDGDLAFVTVSAGNLELLNRRDVGFPYYRFVVDRHSGAVRVSEFMFLQEETDVTENWTAISRIKNGGYYYGDPTGLFDRDDETKWDDRSWTVTDQRTNRCFFVTHFGGAKDYDFSWYTDPTRQVFLNENAPLVPESISQVVTGYRVKENDRDNVYPNNWRVQGGFDSGIVENEWQDLDVVRNATAPGANTWSATYSLSYTNSHVAVENLSLADGSVWNLDVRQGLVEVGRLTPGCNVTVAVTGADKTTGQVLLPVRIASVDGRLSGWKLHFADVPGSKDRTLMIKDGVLQPVPDGLVVVFR